MRDPDGPQAGQSGIQALYRAFLLGIETLDMTDFLQGIDAGFRRFLAFVHKVVKEKLLVLFARMEMMRGQADREHGDFGLQLHLHQATDD